MACSKQRAWPEPEQKCPLKVRTPEQKRDLWPGHFTMAGRVALAVLFCLKDQSGQGEMVTGPAPADMTMTMTLWQSDCRQARACWPCSWCSPSCRAWMCQGWVASLPTTTPSRATMWNPGDQLQIARFRKNWRFEQPWVSRKRDLSCTTKFRASNPWQKDHYFLAPFNFWIFSWNLWTKITRKVLNFFIIVSIF